MFTYARTLILPNYVFLAPTYNEIACLRDFLKEEVLVFGLQVSVSQHSLLINMT